MEGNTKIEGLFITPVPFSGLSCDREVNHNSHKFVSYAYDHIMCERCSTEPHQVSASYPCGADIPYQVTLFLEDGTKAVHELPMNFSWDDIDQIEGKYK